ncbi:hypothetical protein JCM11641_006163 [Rhodosporidiobolus odoratus]
MPSLIAIVGLALISLAILSVTALSLVLYLFTPLPPTPSPSEATYLTSSSPSTPQPLPSLLTPPNADETRVQLSVVVPAYNEADRLGFMLKPTIDYLEDRKLEPRELEAGIERGSYEILIVDDGSRDGTAEKALQLVGEIERSRKDRLRRGEVRVCRLERNRGKGGATKHGVLHTSHPLRILFVDADGATHFPDLELLEAELDRLEAYQDSSLNGGEKHGLVVGSRAHLVKSEAVVKRSALRNLLMRSFHLYLSLLGLSTIRDTQCGFKLSTTSTASLLYPSLHSPGWIFDCELLLLALRCGVPVREVGVRWEEVGGSKLDVMRDSVRMARDLLVIRGNYLIGRWKAPPKLEVIEGRSLKGEETVESKKER